MYQIRAVVFGLGRMGRIHLSNLLSLGIQLVGICDSNSNQIESAKKEYGLTNVYASQDARELIQNCEFNLAIIATTTDARFKTLEYLLTNSNCAKLLIEKPLCQSSSQIDRVERLVETRKDVSIAVNHPMRFMPVYTEIKRFIESNEFGALNTITVLGSNFGLGMNATHYFETYRFLTSENDFFVNSILEVNRVASPRGLQFDDYAGWVIATNRFNQRLSISFPSASAHGLLVNYDFQNAKLLVNELNGQVTAISRQKNFFEEPSYRYGLSSDIYEWSVEIPQLHEVSMQVLSALLSNQNYPNISDAILNTKYAMLCILSSKHSGKTVNLNDFQGEKIETRWP